MIKAYIISILTVLFLLCGQFVYAAEYDTPYYELIAENSVESDCIEVNVYLKTKEYLSSGTFGVRYDSTIASDVVFVPNEDNFSVAIEFNHGYIDSSENNPKRYESFLWHLNDVYDEAVADDNGWKSFHMGTFTVSNIADKKLYKTSFRLLNWRDTPESKEDKFISDENGICLNDQIWRDAAVREVRGYYQGYNLTDEENPVWNDIGFKFDCSKIHVEDGDYLLSAVGNVSSWNSKNVTEVYMYPPLPNGGYDTADSSFCYYDIGEGEVNGRTQASYNIPNIRRNTDYLLCVKKDVHLTYNQEIYVKDEQSEEITMENVSMYCGDINGDDKIKLSDRSILMSYIVGIKRTETKAELEKRCDLNGDGRITLADMNILGMYYNKKYSSDTVY